MLWYIREVDGNNSIYSTTGVLILDGKGLELEKLLNIIEEHNRVVKKLQGTVIQRNDTTKENKCLCGKTDIQFYMYGRGYCYDCNPLKNKFKE